MSEEDKDYFNSISLIEEMVESLGLDEKEIRTLCKLCSVEWEDYLTKKKVNSAKKSKVGLSFGSLN